MVSFGGCISVIDVVGVELSAEWVVGWCEMGVWYDGVGDGGEMDLGSGGVFNVDVCRCVGSEVSTFVFFICSLQLWESLSDINKLEFVCLSNFNVSEFMCFYVHYHYVCLSLASPYQSLVVLYVHYRSVCLSLASQ